MVKTHIKAKKDIPTNSKYIKPIGTLNQLESDETNISLITIAWMSISVTNFEKKKKVG
jgi:hypothetical protein